MDAKGGGCLVNGWFKVVGSALSCSGTVGTKVQYQNYLRYLSIEILRTLSSLPNVRLANTRKGYCPYSPTSSLRTGTYFSVRLALLSNLAKDSVSKAV